MQGMVCGEPERGSGQNGNVMVMKARMRVSVQSPLLMFTALNIASLAAVSSLVSVDIHTFTLVWREARSLAAL